MLHETLKVLTGLCKNFASPVLKSIGFFVVLVMLAVSGPVSFRIIEGHPVAHFILYDLAKGTLVAYILCLFMLLVKPRGLRMFLKACVTVPAVLFAMIDVGSLAMTGSALTQDTAVLIFSTGIAEASGFFSQYFCLKVVVAVLVLLGAVIFAALAVRWAQRRVERYKRYCGILSLAMTFLLLPLMVFGAVKWFEAGSMLSIGSYRQMAIWLGQGSGNADMMHSVEFQHADPLSKALFLIKAVRLQNADFERWEETQKRVWRETSVSVSDADFDIVLVVGESFIRQHSSVYGYYLPTNPRLEAEADSGRLVAFADMLSPANFTYTSLRNLFNMNDLSAGEDWADGVYFPLLMKKAGWKVYHYDNQTVSRDVDAAVAQMFYSPFILENVYDGVSDRLFEYDGDYTEYVDSVLRPRERPGKQLAIYHLMGQHFPASSRFKGSGRFTKDDITADVPWLDDVRRAEVADYDNATLYNDSVVGTIIDGRRERPTVMFYFSDHGEDIWDLAPVEARNMQQPDDAGWLDRQYRIPFFVWMSDAFIGRYPELAARIRGAAARPGMLDNIGQALLGLGGVSTEYYRPDRDIFSDDYTVVERVTADGYHF